MMRTRRLRVPIVISVRLGVMLVLVSAVTGHSSPIRLPAAWIAPHDGGIGSAEVIMELVRFETVAKTAVMLATTSS